MKKQIRKPSVSSGIILDITIKQSYFEIKTLSTDKSESKAPRSTSYHAGDQTEIIIISQTNDQDAKLRDYHVRILDAKPGYTSETAPFYHGQFSEQNMARARKIQHFIKFLNANAYRHKDCIDNQTSKKTIEITYTY